ncbi:MAG: hypothetical protein Q4A16_02180 [Lautropia sp.]|nr:hypothetical protein [Lautropia sp.]
MTTQTSNTPSLQATNASAQSTLAAGRSVNAGTFRLAQQSADQAELTRRALAEKEAAEKKAAAQVEEAAKPSAEAIAETATTDAATAVPAAAAISAEGAAAADSAAEAGTAGTAASSATASSGYNPWIVAAGVVGVAGVAAAASGGSDGNNTTSKTSTNTAGTVGTDTDTTTDTTPPNTTGTGTGTTTDGGTGSGTDNAGDTGTTTDTTTTPTTPNTPTVSGLAEGTLSAPIVANNTVTDLHAGTFTSALSNAGNGIKILKIEAAENTADLDQRIYRVFEGDNGEQTNAYEVIRVDGGVTWAEAQARAAALGGKLVVIDDAAEAEFLRANLSSRLYGLQGDAPWDYAGLAGGAWVGLSQDVGATTVDGGWKWTSGADFTAADWANYGYKLGTQLLPTDGDPSDGVTENGTANYGAITNSWDPDTSAPSLNMLYDFGGKLNLFVIEYEAYESPLKLNNDGTSVRLDEGYELLNSQLDKLSWNSLLNSGGKITFVETDADGNEVGEHKTVTLTEKAASTTTIGFGDMATASSVKADVASLLDDNVLPLI